MNYELLKVLEDLYGVRAYIERKRGSTVQRRRVNRAIRTIQKLAAEPTEQKRRGLGKSLLSRIVSGFVAAMRFVGWIGSAITIWISSE